MVGAVAALGWRLRSARGAERRQVEWFAYVLALLVACVVVAAASLLLPRGVGETIGAVAWNSALALLIFGLPLCIAIASSATAPTTSIW